MMFFLRSGIKGIFPLLLIAVFLLAGIGAWASPDCCGHTSVSARAEDPQTGDPDTGASPQDGGCISDCCQTLTAISPITNVTFMPDPRWSIAGADKFAASHVETDIYRPPIA